MTAAIGSAPDDHFTAGPDCCVKGSGSGRVGGGGRCPAIGAGIVSPAGVQIAALLSIPPQTIISAAGPHCRVTASGDGRIGGAGGCPTIRAGIISPPVFKKFVRQPRPPQTIISLPVHTAV